MIDPIKFQDNNWIIKGDITLNQAPSIMELTIDYEWKNSISIDLNEVKEVDTLFSEII